MKTISPTLQHKNLTEHCKGGAACFIYKDVEKRARVMVGRIVPTDTKGRDNAPEPGSGFICADTPFDRGHIMALEFGGPDRAQNIVPQYAQWQQTGGWKKQENTLKGNATTRGLDILVTVIEYHPETRMDYDKSKEKFQAGKRLTEWVHDLIPKSFSIYSFTSSAGPGKIIKAFLDDKPPDVSAIIKLLPQEATVTMDMSVMPPEDRKHQRKLMIQKAVKDAYRDYEAEWQEAQDNHVNGTAEVGNGKKRTRSVAKADESNPPPGKRLSRRDWLRAEADKFHSRSPSKIEAINGRIITTDMIPTEMRFSISDLEKSILDMHGV